MLGMPTYRIRFTDKHTPDLLIEAADFKVNEPILELRSNDDRHIIALIPLAKLAYIKEEKPSP